jgi:hypothetical protein
MAFCGVHVQLLFAHAEFLGQTWAPAGTSLARTTNAPASSGGDASPGGGRLCGSIPLQHLHDYEIQPGLVD